MRRRYQQWLCNLVLWFSIYICATTLRIDLEKRKLKESRRLIRIYVLIVSTTFLIWQPFAVYSTLAHSPLYVANPVAKYANYCTIMIRLVLILVYILMRHQRDVQLRQWLETVFRIQVAYFDRFKDVPKVKAHRKWIYLNVCLTFIHPVLLATDMNEALYSGHFWKAVDLYPLMGMVGIQHLFMLHHGILLCHLLECLSLINNQLRQNLMDPKLSLIFAQLRSLLPRLNVIYSPVMLCLQLCLIVSNSMVGYIGLLMLMLPELKAQHYMYMFGNGFYLIVLVHMYTYFVICQRVQDTVQEIDDILIESITLADMESQKEVPYKCYVVCGDY